MSNAVQMTALTRSAVGAWVDREERRTGSRMVAYEIVASTVGTSAGWVRKFLGGYHEVKEPSWTVGWNILTAYSRIVDRVEGAAAAEVAEAQSIQRQINEATASTMEMVEGATGAPTLREKA